MIEMALPNYSLSALGGVLIGLSSVLFLVLTGRVAGISGIVGGLMAGLSDRLSVNIAFVVGLLLGPVGFLLLTGRWPVVHIEGPILRLTAAGLLVGFGTRLGSGCTSGHGVSGLARLSPRSIVAVGTFLATGILTVAVLHLVQA